MDFMEHVSPEFLGSNAVKTPVMAKIVVLDAFCWIKNKQKSISRVGSPRTPLG